MHKFLIRNLIAIVLFTGFNFVNFSAYSQETIEFDVNLIQRGDVITNVTDNINVWDYRAWAESEKFPEYFAHNLPFVRYVQLMMAVGGNEDRDLFVNPTDRETLNDYNFSKLIEACRNILYQGLIPHLKIGNIPLKYSKEPKISKSFGVNIMPPDDYKLWYDYVKAFGDALVTEFGVESVKSWRFGVLTEYENKDWFSVDDDSEITKNEYFKLYDYAVEALRNSIDNDIFVGAHSMTVTEGLWDERDFISHCANGINNCTGERGTRLCYLSSSFYDNKPGEYAEKTVQESIDLLRDHAVKEGLNGLVYGIDEGRILQGCDGKDLLPRAVGNTWQAAADARLFKTLLDNDIDYFSQWYFTTKGLFGGVPCVSAHVANLFYKLAGNNRVTVNKLSRNSNVDSNPDCIAAINKDKLYLLFYAYSDSISEVGQRSVRCNLRDLVKSSGKIKVTYTTVSDDSNFFDEWERDQAEQGITDDDFGWSKNGFVIEHQTLKKREHIDYFRSREDYYYECAELKPHTFYLDANGNNTSFSFVLPVHGVVLYEIEL